MFFSQSGKLKFWQIFETFQPWPWKKKSTILDGFFPCLTQMITSMRRCVAYNDLWPWPISSRLLGLDLENRVLSVASTVLDGFLPYVVQMISSMRRCVACDDLWPWPISSRSFGLDLENRVLSVASTVLDGFFPYLVQMISSMRRCVACDDLWPWPISSRSFDLDFENRVRSVASTVLDGFFLYLAQMITIIRRCVACYVFFRIWKLTLTYIFKVIRPWLWKSCPLCNVFSSRLIIFLTWDPIWLNNVGNHEVAGGILRTQAF